MKKQFPPLTEENRIYFSVPYMARYFAKCVHCGFDPEKKLWFTGIHNKNMAGLLRLYDIHEATSEKALASLKTKFPNYKEIRQKHISLWHKAQENTNTKHK